MIRGFLLDEQLPQWWRRQLLRRAPALSLWKVGEAGAPPLQSPDPVLLDWCEAHECVLVTDNRKSMPGHLADHLRQGRHVSGILVVRRGMHVTDLAKGLILIAGASLEKEYEDQIRYFPRL